MPTESYAGTTWALQGASQGHVGERPLLWLGRILRIASLCLGQAVRSNRATDTDTLICIACAQHAQGSRVATPRKRISFASRVVRIRGRRDCETVPLSNQSHSNSYPFAGRGKISGTFLTPQANLNWLIPKLPKLTSHPNMCHMYTCSLFCTRSTNFSFVSLTRAGEMNGCC